MLRKAVVFVKILANEITDELPEETASDAGTALAVLVRLMEKLCGFRRACCWSIFLVHELFFEFSTLYLVGYRASSGS
jgi:hypothetical protein